MRLTGHFAFYLLDGMSQGWGRHAPDNDPFMGSVEDENRDGRNTGFGTVGAVPQTAKDRSQILAQQRAREKRKKAARLAGGKIRISTGMHVLTVFLSCFIGRCDV